METQSRRGVLRNAAQAAVALFGGGMLARKATAQAPSMQKRNATQLPGVVYRERRCPSPAWWAMATCCSSPESGTRWKGRLKSRPTGSSIRLKKT